MPAPKGNDFNKSARSGDFTSKDEPRTVVHARIPESLANKLEAVLEPNETKSSAITEAIEDLVVKRSTD